MEKLAYSLFLQYKAFALPGKPLKMSPNWPKRLMTKFTAVLD